MTRVELQWDPKDRRLDIACALSAGGINAEKALDRSPARLIVRAPVADLRPRPEHSASLDAQILYGDEVECFGQVQGWSCIRCSSDGYVGWTASAALAEPGEPPGHVVTAARSFAYPGPDLKHPAVRALSMGSRIRVTERAETRGTPYVRIETGEWLVACHVGPAANLFPDYVAVAETLHGTPYLWGGGSGFGLDCSGLIQLAMRMCGRTILRDSDMQAMTVGDAIEPGPNRSGLQRGDLVFWKGHVAICAGANRIVHANGFSMDVRTEPLDEALARIARTFAEPTAYRRP